MLGIIGGTSLLDYCGSGTEKKTIHTPYGSSDLFISDTCCILLRHQHRTAPHRLNYRSHLAAMIIAGVTRIVSIGSVGSLKVSIPPGSLLIPDDFISYAPIPTIYDHSIGHDTPEIDQELADCLIKAIPGAIRGGVYIQTSGPRLETKSEIKWFTEIADVIGMTLASEATIASEMKIPFCSICTVDNYANGISNEEISYESIISRARSYHDRTIDMVHQIISSCASGDSGRNREG